MSHVVERQPVAELTVQISSPVANFHRQARRSVALKEQVVAKSEQRIAVYFSWSLSPAYPLRTAQDF